MERKVIKTETTLCRVQCPRCGSEGPEYIDDVEWNKEEFKCSACNLEFVAGFEQQIQYLWWQDDEGAEHEVWDSDLIVAGHVRAMHHICNSLYESNGRQRSAGMDPTTWEMLCAVMESIKRDLPHQEHQFSPCCEDQPRQEQLP